MITAYRPGSPIDSTSSWARQALYRFASRCLLDPRASTKWQSLTDPRDQRLVFEAVDQLRRMAEERAFDEEALDDFNAFAVLARMPQRVTSSDHSEDSRSETTALGSAVSDALAVELQYMACLVGLERRATRKGSEPAAADGGASRRAQLRFFRQHHENWSRGFERLIVGDSQGGFCEALGRFLSAWLAIERDLLGLTLADRLEEMPDETRFAPCGTGAR